MPARCASRSPIFNEKVLAGLGAGLTETGELSRRSQETGARALRRYRLLIGHMGVKSTRVVATAAARDARNGRAFRARRSSASVSTARCSAPSRKRAWPAKACCRRSPAPTASSATSAAAASSSPMSATMRSGPRSSLPLGVLRVRDDCGRRAARPRHPAGALKAERAGQGTAAGRPFYMVGGSWRALARIDMIATDFPLPVKHQYRHAPEARRRAAQAWSLTRPEAAGRRSRRPRLATSPRGGDDPRRAGRRELEPSELIAVELRHPRRAALCDAAQGGARWQDPLIEAARDAGGGRTPLRRAWRHARRLDRLGVRRSAGVAAGSAMRRAC